jgi:hypothetical protein
MTTVDLLREIHALRVERSEAQQEVEQGPQQIKGSQAKLAKSAAVVEALRDQLKALRKESDAKDLQLKTGEARRRDLQGKLNATTNVKEFNAIKEEIARIEAGNAILENEGLEILNQYEAKEAEIEAAKREHAGVEEKHAKLKEVIDYKVEKFKARMETNSARIAELEAQLEPAVRADYERAVSKRGDSGLAPCINGNCGSCHSMQTPQAQQNIAMGRIVFCGSCAAMLFRGE